MTAERPWAFRCGAESLLGVLHPPREPGCRTAVLVVVGGPQYRVGSHRQFVVMARALAQAGFAAARFDYRGMGDSDGEVRTFEDCADDVRAAIDALFVAMPQLSQVVIWGLCDAASAALLHATADRRVAGLVLVNPWVRTAAGEARAYVQHYYGQRLLQLSFWKKVLSGKFAVGESLRSFVSALKQSRGARTVAAKSFIERMLLGFESFERPVLVLISERDLTAAEFVTLCENDARWKNALGRRNVTVVRLAGADHTFSGRDALDAATGHCLAWLAPIA